MSEKPTIAAQMAVIVTFYPDGFHVNALSDASPQQAMAGPQGQAKLAELAVGIENAVISYIQNVHAKLTQKKEEVEVDYKQ